MKLLSLPGKSQRIWGWETPGAAAANEDVVVAREGHNACGCGRRREQQHQQMKLLSLPEKPTAHLGVGDAKSSTISK